jgi:hypothetical protein
MSNANHLLFALLVATSSLGDASAHSGPKRVRSDRWSSSCSGNSIHVVRLGHFPARHSASRFATAARSVSRQDSPIRQHVGVRVDRWRHRVEWPSAGIAVAIQVNSSDPYPRGLVRLLLEMAAMANH